MKVKHYRLTARIFGTIIVAFWLMMGFGYALTDSEEPFTYESAIITTLIIITTIGIIVAWRKEKAGAIILVISGLTMSVFAAFAAGHNHLYAILVSGLPFIITGILFYLAWQKSTNKNT